MYLRNYSIRPLVSTMAIVGLYLAAPLIVVAILTDAWWVLGLAALLILGGWIGFFHTGRRVLTAQEQADVETSSAGLALVPYVVAGFLGGSYLQAGLNRAWTQAGARERERMSAAAKPRPSRAARSSPPEAATATNLVTPEHLGSRVTFQFELPNGYTTEAVGVFERWTPRRRPISCGRGRERGQGPGARVIHGKVIPARPAAPTPR